MRTTNNDIFVRYLILIICVCAHIKSVKNLFVNFFLFMFGYIYQHNQDANQLLT